MRLLGKRHGAAGGAQQAQRLGLQLPQSELFPHAAELVQAGDIRLVHVLQQRLHRQPHNRGAVRCNERSVVLPLLQDGRLPAQFPIVDLSQLHGAETLHWAMCAFQPGCSRLAPFCCARSPVMLPARLPRRLLQLTLLHLEQQLACAGRYDDSCVCGCALLQDDFAVRHVLLVRNEGDGLDVAEPIKPVKQLAVALEELNPLRHVGVKPLAHDRLKAPLVEDHEFGTQSPSRFQCRINAATIQQGRLAEEGPGFEDILPAKPRLHLPGAGPGGLGQLGDEHGKLFKLELEGSVIVQLRHQVLYVVKLHVNFAGLEHDEDLLRAEGSAAILIGLLKDSLPIVQ
mmetsp:Transcript_17646/g.44768  ORF Transcript_17646/g.44768 Transcript_17646/m.44768 type:complete len:342 (+) Transcript_17646:824-1849(+)